MANGERVQLDISKRCYDAAVACLETVANDRREPQRYRDWYSEALRELRAKGGPD